MKKVIIASKNPVKIDAVKAGFSKMLPAEEFIFEGVSIPSDVDDQPMSSKETLTGAMNRVSNAKSEHSEADYWVGIEGGLEKIGAEMSVFAWVVIESSDTVGKSQTSTFYLPQKIVDLIEEGKELSEADDIVFGRQDSGQKNGMVGILTGDIVTRTDYYRESVLLALIPFKNSELY